MSLRINRMPGGTIERHSLSLAFARQLPQRGSRVGFFHSTGCLRNRKAAGDFHRPYGTQNGLHSAIHLKCKIFQNLGRVCCFSVGV